MHPDDRRVDPLHGYLAAVTVLAGASILLLYLLFRVAVPEAFTAFAQAPVAAVGNHPRSVALFLGALLVIGLLVVTVVGFGVRAANRAPIDEEYPPRGRE